MNVFIVAMKNYVFLERGRSNLSKNFLFSMGTMKTFIWLLPGFPLFSQYVSTLFANTESDDVITITPSADTTAGCKTHLPVLKRGILTEECEQILSFLY